MVKVTGTDNWAGALPLKGSQVLTHPLSCPYAQRTESFLQRRMWAGSPSNSIQRHGRTDRTQRDSGGCRVAHTPKDAAERRHGDLATALSINPHFHFHFHTNGGGAGEGLGRMVSGLETTFPKSLCYTLFRLRTPEQLRGPDALWEMEYAVCSAQRLPGVVVCVPYAQTHFPAAAAFVVVAVLLWEAGWLGRLSVLRSVCQSAPGACLPAALCARWL